MKIFKILFFVGAFFAVIFTVMANMGGSNDTLKGAIESFLSDATGYNAQVTTLNNMSFFPSISVDISDVKLFSKDDNVNPVATMKRADIALSFWTVMFKTQKIKRFFISELNVEPNIFTTAALSLDKVGIFETAKGRRAYFVINGKLGDQNLSARAEMEKSGTSYKPLYSFGENVFMKASLGELKAEGIFNNDAARLNVTDLKIKNKDHVLSGELFFLYEGAGRLAVSGDLNFDNGTSVHPDFRVYQDDPSIKGDVVVSGLQIDNVLNEKGFPFVIREAVDMMIGSGNQQLLVSTSSVTPYEVDINLKVKDLSAGGNNVGGAVVPFSLNEGHIVAGPVSGTIYNQELSGTACVDANLFGIENIIYALANAHAASSYDFSEIYPCDQFNQTIAPLPSEGAAQ